ncbi:MAG: LysR family transcriptional regulator [gamma proteobacterium symbiont of Bathyaustriella thionipta]|nr:LysR family transcriptional regulator [gamma proteobacterium symbiont of Bathyaustriella thionipta]
MALNITFRQLRVFESAARHLSYTMAASELHLSQPAVSMQIKQLEETLGLPLFEQIGKKMHLTAAGNEIRQYSHSISQLVDEMETVTSTLKGGKGGRLAISVATTASHFATRLLASFAQLHPDVTISLDITNRESLCQQLQNNEPDLVIMGQAKENADVIADSFMQNPLVMIATPGHTLASQSAIPIKQFEDERFVVREAGSGTRAAIERFFIAAGVSFHTGMEMTSNEAIKQAVEAGLGLGIVSRHTIGLELRTGNLISLDVQGFPIMRDWYVVHRKGKRLSPVAKKFREFVLSEAEKLA